MEVPRLWTPCLKWEVMVINGAPEDVAVGGGITPLSEGGSQAPSFLSLSPNGYSLFLCESIPLFWAWATTDWSSVFTKGSVVLLRRSLSCWCPETMTQGERQKQFIFGFWIPMFCLNYWEQPICVWLALIWCLPLISFHLDTEKPGNALKECPYDARWGTTPGERSRRARPLWSKTFEKRWAYIMASPS